MKAAVIVAVIVLTGCSHKKPVHEMSMIPGHCNVVIGYSAPFDPDDSYQISIHPDTELQREYAIEAVDDFYRTHTGDAKCSEVYRKALAELKAYKVGKP